MNNFQKQFTSKMESKYKIEERKPKRTAVDISNMN